MTNVMSNLSSRHTHEWVRALRTALGQFATGVVIATSRWENGLPAGLTINSFSSVSLEPPLILWSLSCKAPSCDAFLHSRYFAVNILAKDQHDLSRQFACGSANKFKNVSYKEGIGTVPLIEGCVAQFECRRYRILKAGDHHIVLGRVLNFMSWEREALIFHNGAYGVPSVTPSSLQSLNRRHVSCGKRN